MEGLNLQAMRRLLHKHHVCVNNDVESILGARVPIIKFKDSATGALCSPAYDGSHLAGNWLLSSAHRGCDPGFASLLIHLSATPSSSRGCVTCSACSNNNTSCSLAGHTVAHVFSAATVVLV